jgi:hypothetical protein
MVGKHSQRAGPGRAGPGRVGPGRGRGAPSYGSLTSVSAALLPSEDCEVTALPCEGALSPLERCCGDHLDEELIESKTAGSSAAETLDRARSSDGVTDRSLAESQLSVGPGADVTGSFTPSWCSTIEQLLAAEYDSNESSYTTEAE